MGRALLVARLAVRDLRRRPGEAALLLMALTAATFTLTLGLVLRDLAHAPFERTRAATAGPDVTAQGDLDALAKLTRARGVAAHSGPYPMAQTSLAANGKRSAALAQGRDVARAKVDQPKVTEGSWVRAGGVVVERSFADALGVHAGDALTVSSRRLRVAGVAVTAAVPAYPSVPWIMGPESRGRTMDRGLIWLTRADASALGTPRRVFPYMVNLRLSDPAAARAFVAAHEPPDPSVTGKPPTALLEDWRRVAGEHADLVRSQRRVLLTGSWLLALLALASVSVLVGGRMASQIRRVGLLKAVGGTPVLVAAVLLAQYLALALVAAAAGLGLGRLFAPELGRPTAGLLGSTGPIPFTAGTIGVVTAVAVAVAMVATAIPALRAARTSTVLALADAARAPRRSGWLIALSARLPVPLLLGLRMAARRPRRVVLSAFSVMVAVSGTVAALCARAELDSQSGGLSDPRTDRLSQVLLLITVMLVALAAVNAIFVTWATVLDARRASALARALGATPGQVSGGLSAAQVIPALAGALAGVPAGLALYVAVDPDGTTMPPLWKLLATGVGSVLAIAALTLIPSRVGARRAVADVLRSEVA